MPVNTPHADYTANILKWQRCRDAYEGEDAIKARNETYLPKLSSMLNAADPKYIAYKERAMFMSATTRTVEGLVGMCIRKPIDVTIPDKFKYLTDDITDTGINLTNFIKNILSEVTLTARAGLLVDRSSDADGRPYVVLYSAEHVLNWRFNDAGFLSLLVLQETRAEVDPKDVFKVNEKIVYRHLYLDDEGYYQISIWQEDPAKKGEFIETRLDTPTLRGNPMTEIPFIFVSPQGTDPSIEKPPLLDMINVNISHYRTSADLEHGRHFTALPTPYIFGVDLTEDENGNKPQINIGSETAVVSENAGGTAGYMEFTGQGLSALERAMDEKAGYMIVLGATILQTQKKGVESADTARLNKSSETSTMVSIVFAVEDAVKQALELMVAWENAVATIDIEINKDLLDQVIDYQTITALLGAWQQGAISHETLLFNYKRGELLPDDITIEQELGRIDTETPNPVGDSMDLNPQDQLPPQDQPPGTTGQ